MSNELREHIATVVARYGHHQWQADYRKQNPDAMSRWKPAGDDAWVNACWCDNDTTMRMESGVNEIDILNRSYEQLSPAWQAENLATGYSVADCILNGTAINVDKAAAFVHDEWIKRNPWADEALKVSFDELTEGEKDKDRAFVIIGLQEFANMLDAFVARSTSLAPCLTSR